uniref:Uncharacterized protein n=1 Tax=Candidatus Nitrotoga fabula TaxID=2182327 RepID=A0A2X0SIN4_9PROT|nr:protein of unknown function [Candidatus Nitrotoga fabula]
MMNDCQTLNGYAGQNDQVMRQRPFCRRDKQEKYFEYFEKQIICSLLYDGHDGIASRGSCLSGKSGGMQGG